MTVKIFFGVLSLVICSCFNLLDAMLPDENGKIAINNEQKTMIRHVTDALLWGEKLPFSTTRVIKYKEEKFLELGDILNIDGEVLDEIEKNNYVYVPFYNVVKTRLSQDLYVAVGVIIVGTRDVAVVDCLFEALIRRFAFKDYK